MKVESIYNRKTGQLISERVIDEPSDPKFWDKVADIFWDEIQRRLNNEAITPSNT